MHKLKLALAQLHRQIKKIEVEIYPQLKLCNQLLKTLPTQTPIELLAIM
jgi:hypothetical protein